MNDMQAFVNADDVSFRCPCGATSTVSDGMYWESSRAEHERWLSEHGPHSSGFVIEHITPDGARFVIPPRKPRRRKL